MASCQTSPLREGDHAISLRIRTEERLADDDSGSADIFIDEVFVGSTRASGTAHNERIYMLASGRHTVKVTMKGYEPWEKTFLVVKKGSGAEVRLSPVLKKVQPE